MALLQQTIDLLNRDKGFWPQTATDTGLGREWLSKLSQGAIGDPGVVKIEKLNTYLRKKYEVSATD